MKRLTFLFISLALCFFSAQGQTTAAWNKTYICGDSETCSPTDSSFYVGTTLYCWSRTGATVTQCNGTNLVPFSSQPIPYSPCYGYINFQIGSTRFWLNDTTFTKYDGSSWVEVAADTIKWYLARFRSSEGVGWAYCNLWAPYYGQDPLLSMNHPFFYDGNYKKLSTDANGVVQKSSMTIPQSLWIYFFSDTTDESCKSPACCWFQDVIKVNSTYEYVAEIFHNSSGFFIWQDQTWNIYTGEFNAGLVKCAAFFSDASFTDPLEPEYRYSMINGSIFKLVNGALHETATVDARRYFQLDPEAQGGLYYEHEKSQRGMYLNASGVFSAKIVDGQIIHTLPEPLCTDFEELTADGIPSHPNPYCNFTDDAYDSYRFKICNPNIGASNQCPMNYKCSRMPEVLVYSKTCTLGLCLPDYDMTCAKPAPANTSNVEMTTSAVTAITTTISWFEEETKQPLKKYGEACTVGTDCFTGFCWGGNCVCNNCTKIYPTIHYDLRTDLTYYGEKCIPVNSTISTVGETCDMWANVPTKYCNFGSVCSKCPETWASSFSSATCIPLTLNNTACGYSCGYLANCSLIGGVVPSCICPTGYHLEANLRDCYGWKISAPSSCSVFCGNGVTVRTRYCDKAPRSTVSCDGEPTDIVETCLGEFGECPLNRSMLPAAVQVGFESKIVTVELFRSLAKESIRHAITNKLNYICSHDGSAYEDQCCPGRVFPSGYVENDCLSASSGVTIANEYTNGVFFTFLIFAQGNPNSYCCTVGSSKAISRRKRSTWTDHMDQDYLVEYVQHSDIVSAMNSALKVIDPNVEITFASINNVTTTTTTTMSTPVTSKEELSGIGSMSIAEIGVLAAFLGVAVSAIVILAVLRYYIKRRKAMLHVKSLLKKSKKPQSTEMVRQKQVGTGDTNRKTTARYSALRGLSASPNQVHPQGVGQQAGMTAVPNGTQYPPGTMSSMNPQQQQQLEAYNMEQYNNYMMNGVVNGNVNGNENYPAYFGQYQQVNYTGNGNMMAPQAAHGY